MIGWQLSPAATIIFGDLMQQWQSCFQSQPRIWTQATLNPVLCSNAYWQNHQNSLFASLAVSA
jgi:hypothetical protein